MLVGQYSSLNKKKPNELAILLNVFVNDQKETLSVVSSSVVSDINRPF